MKDAILESIFLDDSLWKDAIEHGVDKGIPMWILEQYQDPSFRAQLCREIEDGTYRIQPPHTGYRPKEDGGERTYFANEPQDRVLLFVVYRWLLRNEGEMIHPSCLSYQEGIGVPRIVRGLSQRIVHYSQESGEDSVVGRKFDIHKYFESVDRRCIHQAFDRVEEHHGHSSVIDMLRRFYDSDVYFDSRLHALQEAYCGIKQGCAVSAWLANVILYPMDECLTRHSGLYLRYSDDIIYVGHDYEDATADIRSSLREVGLVLNDRKMEDVRPDRFVRFLGYNIRGREITLTSKWVHHFQQEVEQRTIRNTRLISQVRRIRKQAGPRQEQALESLLRRATKALMRFLYVGDGRFAWANHVLGVVNRQTDIDVLSQFCLDALRAVYTGKTAIGGLGVDLKTGIVRGQGRNVAANRAAMEHLQSKGWVDDFYSVSGMQRIISNKWLYRAFVADKMKGYHRHKYPVATEKTDDAVSQMETLYADYLHSHPDGKRLPRFYAKDLQDLSHWDMLIGQNRSEARQKMEEWISCHIDFDADLQTDPACWFWQSTRYPSLVLFRSWFDTPNE